MTLRVYGDSISGNCHKVRWVLDRLSRPYEWRETDVLSGATRTPEFLAINPAGQVPTVVLEDGRTLAQSNAIMLHLAEGTDLVPADAYDRARMFEWLFWEQYSHEPYVAVRRFHLHYLKKAPAELDPKLFERGSAALARMEAGLADGDYLAGGRLSLADLALLAYTRLSHEGGFDLRLYPRVRAWVARVEGDLGLPAA
ncbi:glutathione S-transferase family protein [Caulobacter sp. 17J80-11]|uniref:glutathione S-transferase family protein n=1 Tax=Caulobacter sp. 17J80-11 TaxID=2763502 RepID=UPI0016535165|nr:glutathione S-transferase N-terminal domain-containing protein [Caulobacter sp. 17J80-11]MBC6981101.1 glutathione S-transferase N-terminal domain-containing protein [Caulobacter sp. 17J80-11]